MRIQSLNHCRYRHLYHIVWGTKYRRHFLKPDVVQAFLKANLYQTCAQHPELYIFAVETDLDHVHIQIEIAPSVSVASAVKQLKGNASRALKTRFSFIRKMYLDSGVWSVGYFSSTNGLDEAIVRRYIERQGRSDYPTNQARFEFE